MRLIDADCLRDYMWYICGETDEEIDKGRAKWESGLWIRYKVFEEALEWLRERAVDAEPIRHGRWIAVERSPLTATCSVCGTRQEVDCGKYCGECGAKMDEVE